MPRPSIRSVAPLVVAFAALAIAAPCSGLPAPHRAAARAAVLLGDTATETQRDSLKPGRLRAIRMRARASGLAAKVRLYIDSGSRASAVLVGIYRNDGEGPGALLDAGVLSSPRSGSWNSLPFVLHQLLSGHTYWLAVLAEGGTLRYRTRPGGRCRSETSLERHLRALPASWGLGGSSAHARCPISAYALAVAAGVPRGTVPNAPVFAPGPPSPLVPTSPGSPPPSEETSPPQPPGKESPPLPPPPVNTALPVIGGTVAVEGTLTATKGTWSGKPTGYSFQWQDCDSSGNACAAIAGATASTHKVGSGEVGNTVRVVVTASNTSGSTPATSAHTSIVPGASGGLFISPAGSDSSSCTQAQPCLTMNHAYREAQPGQTVQMLAGSYPGQAIESDSSKTSSSDVVFTPAEGASVQVTGTIHVFASHLTIENMTVQDVVTGNYDQTVGRPDPTDITLLGLTGRNFEIDSTTNVTVEGGSWGPASACGGPYGGNNNSIRQPTSTAPANILIDNTVIHDVQSYDLVECHIEGLAIFAGTNVTVSNSTFYGNSVYDVLAQSNSGGHPDNVTLANNWFAAAVDNSGANGEPVGSGNGIALGNELSANVTVDSNRFNDVLNMNDAGDISQFTNVHVHGNVGMMPYSNYPCGSLSGIEWSQNIWQNDKCASSDVDLGGAAMPYKQATNDSTLDYTLTGAYENWPEPAG
jgi:hypothetical protein